MVKYRSKAQTVSEWSVVELEPITEALAFDADKTFALNHTYLDNCEYSVEVCVGDDDGEIGCDALVVNMANGWWSAFPQPNFMSAVSSPN